MTTPTPLGSTASLIAAAHIGELLLHLQAPAQGVDHPTELAQADNPSARYVGDVK